ncbi:MAG: dihydropteroate synthase [Terrimicrobiaceae bacterium]|nr:dihydropteroate synthase [Terrimicrobiaceae bacterium]
MIWRVRGRDWDLARRGAIMGILNVTPDSFSDGGSYLSVDAAVSHALEMVDAGTEIIDIGGESTRPGSEPVDADEELRRTIPVIQALRGQTTAHLSIDTSKAIVAREALAAGADIVNDVTGLRGDPEMASVCADSRAGVVIMHMQGTPRTMQSAPHYSDVVADVREFFRHSLEQAVSSGIDPMSIALDPGIGFGKTFDHNRTLLRSLPEFGTFGRPLLIGVSRKSFLGAIAGSNDMADRFWPGVALTSFCRERGARILRVHDVQPHREALRMTEAIVGDA